VRTIGSVTRFCVVTCVVTLRSLPVAGTCRAVSLGINHRTTNKRLSRMNIGLSCARGLLCVIQASFGHRIRDQGVGGSNPLSPTISNQVLADTRRVGEKQGLPQKDLHWRKCFLCGHELPPYSSGSHAHGFDSLFPPRLVIDILGHVDCGMSHVVPRYLWPDAG
jgi:hypothetical protein